MELASNFSDKAASVACVGRSSPPFANVLGEKIGTMLKKAQLYLIKHVMAVCITSPLCLLSLFNILLRWFNNLASSFNQVHESKGVKFITDAAVKEFKGENGKVAVDILQIKMSVWLGQVK